MMKALALGLLKVLVMVLFFIIVVVVGTLPFRSKTFKQYPCLQAIGATFAGALFMNVAVMHILSQSLVTEQNLEHLRHSDKEAYILTMAIYFHTIF